MICELTDKANEIVNALVIDGLLDISSLNDLCFHNECALDPENVYCSTIFSFPINGPQHQHRIAEDWIEILETLPPRAVVLCPCQPVRIPEGRWPSSKPWLFSNNAHYIHPTMDSNYSRSYYQYLPMGFWCNSEFYTRPYAPWKERLVDASFIGTTYTWPILRTKMVQAHIDHLHELVGMAAMGATNGFANKGRFVAEFDLQPGYYYYGATGKSPDEKYIETMEESKFTLCPRGDNVSSLRLYEAIAAGSIPIIFSDDCILPHIPDIDLLRECVRIPECLVDKWVEIVTSAYNAPRAHDFHASLSKRLRDSTIPGGYLHPNSLPTLVDNEITIAAGDTLQYYGNYFD